MPQLGRRRWWATFGAALWMGLIFLLSAQRTLPRAGGVPVDVAAIGGHLVAYAVLATLIRVALGPPERNMQADVIAVALATLYGLSDEYHQSFVPGRDASSFDLMVDLAGAMGGVAMLELARSLRRPANETR